MPGYLKLCIKTWRKFLPEYEINILNYKRAREFIGKKIFSKIISKRMSLPIQADAIRVAVLKKYGGIWLDTDTIITNGSIIKNNRNYELVMIGENKMQYIAFIYASNNSSIINEWLKEIITKVYQYEHTNNKSIYKEWNYLGNEIIDRLLSNYSQTKYLRLDKNKILSFPEMKFFNNTSLNKEEKYKFFYFQNIEPTNLLNDVKGIILLHNSWTPLKYKKMSEEEFLAQDIFLSKLLKKILLIK